MKLLQALALVASVVLVVYAVAFRSPMIGACGFVTFLDSLRER